MRTSQTRSDHADDFLANAPHDDRRQKRHMLDQLLGVQQPIRLQPRKRCQVVSSYWSTVHSHSGLSCQNFASSVANLPALRIKSSYSVTL